VIVTGTGYDFISLIGVTITVHLCNGTRPFALALVAALLSIAQPVIGQSWTHTRTANTDVVFAGGGSDPDMDHLQDITITSDGLSIRTSNPFRQYSNVELLRYADIVSEDIVSEDTLRGSTWVVRLSPQPGHVFHYVQTNTESGETRELEASSSRLDFANKSDAEAASAFIESHRTKKNMVPPTHPPVKGQGVTDLFNIKRVDVKAKPLKLDDDFVRSLKVQPDPKLTGSKSVTAKTAPTTKPTQVAKPLVKPWTEASPGNCTCGHPCVRNGKSGASPAC
jgi:hypothetical protein